MEGSKLDNKLIEKLIEDIYLIAENREIDTPRNYLDSGWFGQAENEIRIIYEIIKKKEMKTVYANAEKDPMWLLNNLDKFNDEGSISKRTVVTSFIFALLKAYSDIITWRIFSYLIEKGTKFFVVDNPFECDYEFDLKFGGVKKTLNDLVWLFFGKPLELYDTDDVSASYLLSAVYYLYSVDTFTETITQVIPDFDFSVYYFSEWFDKSVIKIFRRQEGFQCFFDDKGEPYTDKEEYDKQFGE